MIDVEISEGSLPMLEMSCPEFFVTHIGDIEYAGGACVRIYCCVVRGKNLEPVYSVVMPIDALIVSAKTCSTAAAHARNEIHMRPSQAAH